MGAAAAPKAMKAMKRVNVLAKKAAAAPKAMKAMKRVSVIAKKAAATPKKAMNELKDVYFRSSASGPWWLCQLRCVGVSAQSWSVGAHGGKPQSTDSCSSVRPSLNVKEKK